MPRYKLILYGQNLLIDIGNGYEKAGFYTPRYVDAPDPALVEATAIEDFIHSDKYKKIKEDMMNTSDDPPHFSVEDLEQCPDKEFYETGKLPGLAFYSAEEKA